MSSARKRSARLKAAQVLADLKSELALTQFHKDSYKLIAEVSARQNDIYRKTLEEILEWDQRRMYETCFECEYDECKQMKRCRTQALSHIGQKIATVLKGAAQIS